MKKIRFLFQRLFDFNYKNFFKTINSIHKEKNIGRIHLFFDMIHCGVKYGAGYKDYELCAFYDLTEQQRATYVTRGVNNTVVGLLNNKDYMHYFADKRDFNNMFAKFIGRKWIDMKKADIDSFRTFAKGLNRIICKPADDCCGHGVEMYSFDDYSSPDELFELLKSNGTDIAEEYIVQHDDIAKINPYSVNTLRIVTARTEGVTHVLYAFIRIGNGRAIVDNINNGGMAAPIDLDTGIVTHPGFDKDRKVFERHPDTGCEIVGCKIPYWEESLNMCIQASSFVPEVGYVGWDVAVTSDGPLLVEGNQFPGHDILQMPPHVPDKIGLLPRYKMFIKELR